jgi:hypothetical protein
MRGPTFADGGPELCGALYDDAGEPNACGVTVDANARGGL